MNNLPSSDPNEQSFAEWLKQGARELREKRGPCPTAEDLVAFHERRLPVEQEALLRDHVEACGLCDVQLGRLENADGLGKRGRLWTAIGAFLQKPLVPYSLVALLVIPAYWGLFRHSEQVKEKPAAAVSRPAEPEFSAVPIASFSLDAVRSESQVQKTSVIRLSQQDKFFLLSFFIPIKSAPSYHYEIAVLRSDRTPLISAQPLTHCNGVGNCLLLCNSELFSPGRYELLITEKSSAGGRTMSPMAFEIAR